MPDEARRLLETDRPWRAARLMREYLDEVDRPSEADRLLAARAEARYGDWERVSELLDDDDALQRSDTAAHLVARARDELGDDAGAIEAYEHFLERASAAANEASQLDVGAARLRLALARLRVGNADLADQELAQLKRDLSGADDWLTILRADALARAGDTAAVRLSVEEQEDGILGLRAWRARVAAARNAGDAPGARALANEARDWARTDGTTAEFFVAAARAALDMGDTLDARAALRAAIDRDPAGAHGRAAAALLAEGEMAPDDHLAMARVLVEQGLQEDALPHFEAWLDARRGDARERRGVRMEYANALHYAQRFDEVGPALDPLGSSTEVQFLKARSLATADRVDEAVGIYKAIAGEHSGSPTALRALYLTGDTYHDADERDDARQYYEEVVRRYPRSNFATLASLRLAGMSFLEGDFGAARTIWDNYRRRSPRGEYAVQATYWSGRAREERGDSVAAARVFRDVREMDRESYYALRASERLGEPFWPIPMEESPPPDAAVRDRVATWMGPVAILVRAGFPDEAAGLVQQIVDRAGRDREVRYSLGEALTARGYTRRAIILAIGLRDDGPTNERLLRIRYPFPYRTLVTEEAKERGFDPFVAAALIRQESLFEARITSHVGARGLMQLMPGTGREVAALEGIENWDAETLYEPEMNVHLGTRLLADHLESWDGSLPSVFGAYNAGPHRVERWVRYPEFGQDELFTERIPFAETRDYVKILTRNRALYQGLWGE